MKPTSLPALAFASLTFAVACGGSEPRPATPAPEPAPAPTSNADLAKRGGELYGANCAKCHGDAGQGTDKGPAVVGVAAGALPRAPRAGAKRTVEFRTAGDILAWMSEYMPGDAPGSLTAEEYLAILAFDLTANGVELGAEPFTAERAAAMVIHPD
jgi:mono/diheme cytochrome c family protein